MPTLISEDKAGNLTQGQRADLENELYSQGGSSSAGFNSQSIEKPLPLKQTDLDNALSGGTHVLDGMTTAAIAEFKSYLVKNGVPEAKIDRALRLDGVPIPPPSLDPDVAEVHRQSGTPVAPEPLDYLRADLNRPDLPPERQANAGHVTRQWAADMKLSSELGKAVLENVTQIGAELAKKSPEEVTRWKDQQYSLLLKTAGSRAALRDIRDKAEKILRMSGAIKNIRGEDEHFSAAVLASPAFESAWLQQTLANHFQALEATELAKKRL